MASITKNLAGGVTVEVPTQSKTVNVETRAIPSSMPATPGVFSPGRVLVNFVVTESSGARKLVTTFNPPLKVTVKYTSGDVQRAGGESNLVLAFWNESEWVPFTFAKHKFTLHSDGKGGGNATLEIKNWGDPPMAWGP